MYHIGVVKRNIYMILTVILPCEAIYDVTPFVFYKKNRDYFLTKINCCRIKRNYTGKIKRTKYQIQ